MQELKFKKFKKETFIDSLNNQFKEEEEKEKKNTIKINTKKKNKTTKKKQNTAKTKSINKTSIKKSPPKNKSNLASKNKKTIEFKTIINKHTSIFNNHKKIHPIKKAFKTKKEIPPREKNKSTSISQLFFLSSCKIIKNQIDHQFKLHSIFLGYNKVT